MQQERQTWIQPPNNEEHGIDQTIVKIISTSTTHEKASPRVQTMRKKHTGVIFSNSFFFGFRTSFGSNITVNIRRIQNQKNTTQNKPIKITKKKKDEFIKKGTYLD